jgi:hypothetical protein
VVAFGLASVVNPGYFTGCASDADEDPGTEPGTEKFEFGEAEMLGLLDEANATGPFEIMRANVNYRVEIVFSQRVGQDQDDSAGLQPRAAFMPRAYACGTRTFMQSASACITMSEVLFSARLDLYRLDGDGETQLVRDQQLEARLWVTGTKLTNAEITIGNYGATSPTKLTLISNDGKSFKLAQFMTKTADVTID